MILKHKTVWLPLLVMVALATTTAIISWHLEGSQNQKIQLETSIVAEQVGLHLEEWISDRITILDHFADIFPDQHSENPVVFQKIASRYLDSYSGFITINWIETDGQVRIVTPEEVVPRVLQFNLQNHPDSSIRDAFRRAVAGNQTELTPIVDLMRSDSGFITFRAIRDHENRIRGVIASEYSICTMADACLADPKLRENYRLSLSEPDGLIVYRHDDRTPRGFASESTLEPGSWPGEVRVEVSVLHTPWMLTIAPSASSLAAIHTVVDDFVLLGGLLLSLLVGWLIRVGLVRQAILQESKDRFRRLVEGVDAMVWEFDFDENRFVYMSPHARTILGYSLEELYQPGFWLQHIHPDDREQASTLSHNQLNHGESVDLEYRIETADGGVVWLRDISGKMIEEQGHRRQKGVMIDITKHKRLELLREERNRVVEQLAENAPLSEILTLITESAETVFPGMRCSILLLDPQTQCLRHGAAPSLPDYYNQAVDGLAIGSGVASCGAAAHDNKRVIIEDVMTHPNWGHLRSLASRVGFRACWSEPIADASGVVLGTLAIYYEQPRTPTGEELAIIESVSLLAGIAIERTRNEKSFQDLITGTASVTGNSFFPVLVKHLAHANGVRHAIVTELVNDQLQVLAFWNVDREGEPITYAVDHTPCEMVMRDGEYFCSQGVQSLFPDDPDLVELKAESYYGVTLVDGQDRTIGHICVLDDKPILDGSRIARIVRLFAIRAAAELERKRTQDSLRQKTEQLTAVTESLAGFLESDDWPDAVSSILKNVLRQTDSEYGFIGMMTEGPTLRMYAHEGIVWDDFAGRPFYEDAIGDYEEQGYLEFTNFDNLFGHIIKTKKVVVSNDLSADSRAGGLPLGHPPLHSFLGMPILRKGVVVGLIGVANRPGGYSEQEQEKVNILCQATGVLYGNYLRREIAQTQKLALQASEERYRELLEYLPEAVFIHQDERIVYVNETAVQLLGASDAPELLGQSIFDIIHPDHHQNVKPQIHRTLSQSTPAPPRHRRLLALDGRIIETEIKSIRCEFNDRPAIQVVIRDVTQQKRNEKAIQKQAKVERLLRNELDHRVRNNLASLNTVVDMSRRSTHTPEQFTTAVKGRINTMLTAHNLLSRSQGQDIGLCHLIQALAPPELQKQILREGKPVIIHAEKASALAMVLHELLSNSMKHGSMSVPEGRVRLSWEQQDGEGANTLTLQWRESNGPEIDPNPIPGVGTSLIKGIVRSDLQGIATLRYLPSGVDHEFTINLQPTEPPEDKPEYMPVEPSVIVESKPDPELASR